MKQWRYLLGASLFLSLLGGVAVADPPADPMCDHCRAGWPLCISRWAIPSNTPAYCGYYVGGGCACAHLCDCRTPEEGTWGWDYTGWVFCRRVALGWWHGLCQAGTGAYKTDGPKCHEPEKH